MVPSFGFFFVVCCWCYSQFSWACDFCWLILFDHVVVIVSCCCYYCCYFVSISFSGLFNLFGLFGFWCDLVKYMFQKKIKENLNLIHESCKLLMICVWIFKRTCFPKVFLVCVYKFVKEKQKNKMFLQKVKRQVRTWDLLTLTTTPHTLNTNCPRVFFSLLLLNFLFNPICPLFAYFLLIFVQCHNLLYFS